MKPGIRFLTLALALSAGSANLIGCADSTVTAPIDNNPKVKNPVSLAPLSTLPDITDKTETIYLSPTSTSTNFNGIDNCDPLLNVPSCIALENVFLPKDNLAAFVKGLPSQQDNVVTRTNYLLDVENSTSQSGVALIPYKSVQNISTTGESIEVTIGNIIPLPNLIGGPLEGFLAASDQYVYAATAGTPNVQVIRKADNAVSSLTLASENNVIGISTDRFNFTTVVTGTPALPSSEIFGPDNTSLAHVTSGIIVTADTQTAEQFVDAAGLAIQICDQTIPTVTCHDLAAPGTFGNNFAIVETEPVVTDNSSARQFIVWGVDKQTLFIIGQTDTVSNGINKDTINSATIIPITIEDGAPLLASTGDKILFGSTGDNKIFVMDLKTQAITQSTTNNFFVPSSTALSAMSADDYGNVMVNFGSAGSIYNNQGEQITDSDQVGAIKPDFMTGTRTGVSFDNNASGSSGTGEFTIRSMNRQSQSLQITPR